LDRTDIEAWLREADRSRLEALFADADAVRAREVGPEVYLRGLLEISNFCRRECHYCGIRASRQGLTRYRMSIEEIIEGAELADSFGLGTVVLQAGEDASLTKDVVEEIIRRIKLRTNVAITLSLGERTAEEYAAWRQAGADRYLLRFETSNRSLFQRIHPNRLGHLSDRLSTLAQLRDLGYEVGSGVMVGIPGQSYADVVQDLLWFRRLDLDMVGIGPFLAHPDTPLGRDPAALQLPPEEQVPSSDTMTAKVLALTRLLCPAANLPSTTALATLDPQNGKAFGLRCGANIIMPNLTPMKYRCHYEIYPAKACLAETDLAGEIRSLREHLTEAGRTIGQGRGDSPNVRRRRAGGRPIGNR
jgi:biotin synthase